MDADLPSIVDQFACVPGCPFCDGEGYVCEEHPHMPWGPTFGPLGCDCGGCWDALSWAAWRGRLRYPDARPVPKIRAPNFRRFVMLHSFRFSRWAQPVVSKPWAVAAVVLHWLCRLSDFRVLAGPAHHAWERAVGVERRWFEPRPSLAVAPLLVAVVSLSKTVQLNPMLLTFASGTVIPLLTAVVVHSKASAGVKTMTNAILSAVAGAVVAAVTSSGRIVPSTVLLGIVVAFVGSVTSYKGLLNPTGIVDAVAKALPGGIGKPVAAEAQAVLDAMQSGPVTVLPAVTAPAVPAEHASVSVPPGSTVTVSHTSGLTAQGTPVPPPS